MGENESAEDIIAAQPPLIKKFILKGMELFHITCVQVNTFAESVQIQLP